MKSFLDTRMASDERLVLPVGQDFPILSFRFERDGGNLRFIHTDKFGKQLGAYDLVEPGYLEDKLKDCLRVQVEYSCKVQSLFLFKHEISRIFEIPHYTLSRQGREIDYFEWLFVAQAKNEKKAVVFNTAEVKSVTV